MLSHSTQYDEAVTATSRKMLPYVVFDLIDPDYQFEGYAVSEESPYSITEQAIRRASREEEEEVIGSLELNRWILNGSITVEPNSKYARKGHVGWEGSSICDANGYFSTNPWIEIYFSGVSIIQVMTVTFSEALQDGVGEEFTLQFYGGDDRNILLDTIKVTGNTDLDCYAGGYKVYYPTKVRLTINKWSIGYRRVRIEQFLIGIYGDWDEKSLSMLDIYTESTFSGLSLPYSTCMFEAYNKKNLFDPFNPNGLFESIQERQAVTAKIGVRLEDGTVEWIPCGTYYQQSGGGWELQDLTIRFTLLDIIGMLVKKKFIVPDVLPTTFRGWIEAIMASISEKLVDQYRIDSSNVTLTANREDVEDKRCGEILRFACMATNTWARQEMSTGKLWISKIETTTGNKITLDNMYSYPVMSENEQIADITFHLNTVYENEEDKKESEETLKSVTFPGTNTESEISLSINNPFIHTVEDARKAMISCFLSYGGKEFQVIHRGNPTSETGDIQSIDTQFLTTVSARLYKQQLKFEDGVMRNMPSFFVQSPNDTTYSNKIILTGGGTWTATVSGLIKVTLISGGTGGQGGGGGVDKYSGTAPWTPQDEPDTTGGSGGAGGRVFIAEVQVYSGQQLPYSCGTGGRGGAGGEIKQNGEYGEQGGDSSFSTYTTEHGTYYVNGLMDVQSGAVYAQAGAKAGGKVTGSYGTGGTGGTQGGNGMVYYDLTPYHYEIIRKKTPEPGTPGEDGQPGCIILEW